MKIIKYFLLLLLITNFNSIKVYCQKAEVYSASCGSCGKSVSKYSKIGDICAHCNVRWGYENNNIIKNRNNDNKELRISNSKSDFPNLSEPSILGFHQTMTFKNANLWSAPNTKSTIICVIPEQSKISVEKTVGSWHKISYDGLTLDEQKANDLRMKQIEYGKIKNDLTGVSPFPIYSKIRYGWIHKDNIVED
jgi:hypothetical protein